MEDSNTCHTLGYFTTAPYNAVALYLGLTPLRIIHIDTTLKEKNPLADINVLITDGKEVFHLSIGYKTESYFECKVGDVLKGTLIFRKEVSFNYGGYGKYTKIVPAKGLRFEL